VRLTFHQQQQKMHNRTTPTHALARTYAYAMAIFFAGAISFYVTYYLLSRSYTSRILSPTTVWNKPVPLLLPGKLACFNICSAISPSYFVDASVIWLSM